MNVIERFRKYRSGGILKFLNSGQFPYVNRDVSVPAIDSSLEGTGNIYKTDSFKDEPDVLFNMLSDINPKIHNKNTFLQAYDNMKYVYGYLQKKGMTSEEISGIMGNMLAENVKFDPDLKNSGGYKGLVLLSKNLLKYVSNKYGDLSLDNLLNFIRDWARGHIYDEDPSNAGYGYKQYNGRKPNTSRNYAKAWSDWFERHGGGSSLRQDFADMFYKYFNR